MMILIDQKLLKSYVLIFFNYLNQNFRNYCSK